MCNESLNLVEVKLEDGWWMIYKNYNLERGKVYLAKDRNYAVLEARILAKRLAPSEFRIIENGIEVKVEKYYS